jgi:hypothetical protein
MSNLQLFGNLLKIITAKKEAATLPNVKNKFNNNCALPFCFFTKVSDIIVLIFDYINPTPIVVIILIIKN